MEELYISRKRAAELLLVDERTIDRYIKAGVLRARKYGGKVLILAEDINVKAKEEKSEVI